MEALDGGKISLEDKVTCSPNANSMGGSQIWLEVGEEMTVHELLKATAISSANDAACALGEHPSRQRRRLCGPDEPPGPGTGDDKHPF